ncbi:hypothetical protein Chor_007329 [Crotalus horridus]
MDGPYQTTTSVMRRLVGKKAPLKPDPVQASQAKIRFLTKKTKWENPNKIRDNANWLAKALGTKPSWIDALIQAFLEVARVNVIAVDWVQGATAAYPTAAVGVPESSIHLIGVSLGAHVGGLVGQFYEGHLGRITALDPAGPKYTRASPEERLDPGDALFVEAIHTDSDSYQYLICDHMRAVHFYISVLKDSCPMMAFPCSSYKNFLAGHCLDCFDPFLLSCPTLGLLDNGGLNMKTLPREVKVYLATAASAPYCGE